VLRHVSFAPTSHQNLRRATLPTRGGPSFLYRHYTNIYPRPFPSYIGRFNSFLISPERMSYMEEDDHGFYSASAGRGRLERCIFVFVFFFSSTLDSYGWIYLLLLRKRWCLVRYQRARGSVADWLTGWLGGLLVLIWRELYAAIVFGDHILRVLDPSLRRRCFLLKSLDVLRDFTEDYCQRRFIP
jgi:hypothetical protein